MPRWPSEPPSNRAHHPASLPRPPTSGRDPSLWHAHCACAAGGSSIPLAPRAPRHPARTPVWLATIRHTHSRTACPPGPRRFSRCPQPVMDSQIPRSYTSGPHRASALSWAPRETQASQPCCRLAQALPASLAPIPPSASHRTTVVPSGSSGLHQLRHRGRAPPSSFGQPVQSSCRPWPQQPLVATPRPRAPLARSHSHHAATAGTRVAIRSPPGLSAHGP